jgi:putative hydrolase of the HAD superfamily
MIAETGLDATATTVVRAVIFDWGGTLTPWHTVDLNSQWDDYARLYAPDPVAAAELAARIVAAEARAWARSRTDGTSAHLAEVLAAAGVDTDHPGHPAALAAYEEFWEPHTLTDPDVAPLFTGLRKRGIRVGVLSNTIWSRDYHERVFARDHVLHLVDGSVYSSEIGHAKPHEAAFRAAMGAVGVDDPAGCVYVGDRPYEDVHGAQRVGMRAVLVPHSDIPAAQLVPVDVSPDGVAHRLLDVLGMVDAWNAPGAGGVNRGTGPAAQGAAGSSGSSGPSGPSGPSVGA